MSFIYLASPYRAHPHGKNVAFEEACSVTRALLKNGLPVFSPVTHSHYLGDGREGPVPPGGWLEGSNLPILEHAALLLVYTRLGWTESESISGEIEFAKEHGIRTLYSGPGAICTPSLAGWLKHKMADDIGRREEIETLRRANEVRAAHSPVTVSAEAVRAAEEYKLDPGAVQKAYDGAPPRTMQDIHREVAQKVDAFKADPPEWARPAMRTFDTGATRNTDIDKPDYEGFLSPLVVAEFGRYMHAHRKQADGTRRASDNWQKGIPADEYIKSAFRHFVEWWSLHRGAMPPNSTSEDTKKALCALLFNVQGYLHEFLRKGPAKPSRY